MNTIAAGTAGQSALLDRPEEATAPKQPVIVEVARAHKVSPFRQMRETLALRFGAQKLQPSEYYQYCVYDPAIPMADKRTFVGVAGNNALNARLSPPELIPTGAFVGNKLLYTAFLDRLGLATTHTQAVFTTTRHAGKMNILRDRVTLDHFLQTARYPLFGKPLHGSLSAGSVRITALEGDRLVLGRGDSIVLEDFCAEVTSKYAGGYLFQDALVPHPDVAEVTGQAVGCVRIVTVNDVGTPRALYGLWKIPAPTAMSDNFWQAGSMLARVDPTSGDVTHCRRGTGMQSEWIDAHPVSGARITGRTVPFWAEAQALAAEAHAIFPEFGVCGWDIAVTPEGPKIVECNDNPNHGLYQLATGRGILNPDLAPVWERASARQKDELARLRKSKSKG